VEVELLQNTFKVPKEIIHYLPFLVEAISEESKNNVPAFGDRNNFITIGNFQHAPNADSVVYLKKEIWPGIRKQLPKARLHIYGAYAPKLITEMHNEQDGFLIKGWTPEVGAVMQKARVCLAPLRFGAGLKGKLLDAMTHGTPCITTSIGAEGMHSTLPFPGAIKEEVTAFVKASVTLYSEEKRWLEAQQNGFSIIENRFQKSTFSEAFKEKINLLRNALETHRNLNFTGQILQYHTLQSTKFLSKYIEIKNRKQ
jgi:glycosyltransferase involved in cell wall biosynthesis